MDTTPTTDATTQVLQVPIIATRNELIIYISVICGVLGFALLLLLLGWILNEMLVFGDPMYEVIQSISTRSHSSSRNGNTSEIMLPRARNKREYPLWLYHDRSERNTAETNGAFDLDESMRAQYQTAEHLTQICSEMKDTSDSENEDVGCNSSFEKTQASPSKTVEEYDIRPSMVAAYEKQRTSDKRKQENVFATYGKNETSYNEETSRV